MNANVEVLRRQGILLVTVCGWLTTLALCLMSIGFGENALVAAFASALFNALPSYCAWRKRTDPPARMVVALMAAIQPALLVYAMQGSLWQLDMHLYFLVALAALTLLCDIRAIIAACLLIAAHHAILSFAAPDWVFWGGGGLVRVMIHANAVLVIGSVLCWIGLGYRDVLRSMEEERAKSAEQAEKLKQASLTLEEALGRVEAEREASAKEREEVAARRRAEYAAVAEDFERSVNAVTHSVAATSQLMERTARSLTKLAEQAGDDARDVLGSAETASKAANTVARGVAELSSSIANISVNVSQQTELTARATDKSGGGGQAVGSLTEQSKTIGEATRAIVRIAERTNLLSLNAAIEAATAGASGRGFTIVAQEVKALANQAGQAATQIDNFLSGVRSGTLEAERSFSAIDEVISELDGAATSIRHAVEDQRQSADAIEHFARNAAGEVDQMVTRSRALAERSMEAKSMLVELDKAAAALTENVQLLENSASSFSQRLRV
ncbi:methyl-accepting chemotaxis protein [uncultured Erythrobacter sp.]|uniref:methyl-accepting chemotaxis protein n=1 Tax=uncultured Erythrobacter sp. TaxID=263913 RepID=UPI00262950D3|nr:methyl-accepting chemotaxis protein [uncultured Erythrobacter sp.]